MKRYQDGYAIATTMILPMALSITAPALADMSHADMPVYLFSLDRLERRDGSGDPLHWKLHGWAGNELRKLQVKSEGARRNGGDEEIEVELMYSRAISPYWDAGIGWRGDIEPDPRRNWLALGVHGVAPWFIDIDATLYIGSAGRSALRVEASHEILFTQRLILEPALEFDAYGRNDPATGHGAGLSTVSAGLRLRYEITRKLAPYAGIHWQKRYGNTASHARESGTATEDAQALIGLRAWY